MTRMLLSLFVSSTALVVGLASSWVQSENHARAKHLDEMMRDGDLERAGNEGLYALLRKLQFDFERGHLDPEAVADEDAEASADLAGVTE